MMTMKDYVASGLIILGLLASMQTAGISRAAQDRSDSAIQQVAPAPAADTGVTVPLAAGTQAVAPSHSVPTANTMFSGSIIMAMVLSGALPLLLKKARRRKVV